MNLVAEVRQHTLSKHNVCLDHQSACQWKACSCKPCRMYTIPRPMCSVSRFWHLLKIPSTCLYTGWPKNGTVFL